MRYWQSESGQAAGSNRDDAVSATMCGRQYPSIAPLHYTNTIRDRALVIGEYGANPDGRRSAYGSLRVLLLQSACPE